jgi:hypothetical protein
LGRLAAIVLLLLSFVPTRGTVVRQQRPSCPTYLENGRKEGETRHESSSQNNKSQELVSVRQQTNVLHSSASFCSLQQQHWEGAVCPPLALALRSCLDNDGECPGVAMWSSRRQTAGPCLLLIAHSIEASRGRWRSWLLIRRRGGSSQQGKRPGRPRR